MRSALMIGRRAAGLWLLAATGPRWLGGGIPPARAESGQPPAARPACRPAGLWRTLPQAPLLPHAEASGRVRSGDADLYYAEFGRPAAAEPPLLLLHGGLGNSNHWAGLLPAFTGRRVVVLDTRGHGRSTLGSAPLSYAVMAEDVVALLDQCAIARVSIVGWSDGGIVGLALAMTRPERVARLFVFGANTTLDGAVADGSRTETFRRFAARCADEYRTLSPHPEQFARLRGQLSRMWRREPNYAASDLARITAPTTVADGAHEEVISLRQAEGLAAAIPGATLVIQPCVSHFAIFQDPLGFAAAVIASGA